MKVGNPRVWTPPPPVFLWRGTFLTISPAAEVGNLALLDKVFFFTDYFSLG